MKKNIEKQHALIIDIGTAYVTGGIVHENKNGLPELAQVERVPIGSGSETSRQALIPLTKQALKTLVEKYQKQKLHHVRVVVASPWHQARVKTIVSESKKQSLISQKTIEKAVLEYKNQAPPEAGNVDIEAAAMHVEVNGYPTQLARPVWGSALSVHMYESEAGSEIQSAIVDEVHRAFPNMKVSLHTFPLVSSIALRGLTNETSFIVVDCAGEATEMTIIFKDSIAHLSSFGIGYNSMLREFGPNKETPGDARSRLTLFARGELSESEKQEVEKEFLGASAAWKKAFSDSITAASESIPIPRTVFLISDKESLEWLKLIFSSESIPGIVPTLVTPPLFQNTIALGDGGVYDPFLSLESLYFHIYAQELIGE